MLFGISFTLSKYCIKSSTAFEEGDGVGAGVACGGVYGVGDKNGTFAILASLSRSNIWSQGALSL